MDRVGAVVVLIGEDGSRKQVVKWFATDEDRQEYVDQNEVQGKIKFVRYVTR